MTRNYLIKPTLDHELSQLSLMGNGIYLYDIDGNQSI